MSTEAQSGEKQVSANDLIEVFGNDALKEIHYAIKAAIPLIWVVTHEEERFIELIDKLIAQPTNKALYTWSAYQGIKRITDIVALQAPARDPETAPPNRALEFIVNAKTPAGYKGQIYIMKDMHIVMTEPIPRQLRDIFSYLRNPAAAGQNTKNNKKTIIIVSPVLAHGPGGTKIGLPPTLEKQVRVIRFPLPSKQDVEALLSENLELYKLIVNKKKLKDVKVNYSQEEIQERVRALQGLTELEIANSIGMSMTRKREIDLHELVRDKKQIISKSEILEFIDVDVGIADVGGLDLLKDFIEKYKNAHSDEARAFGVKPLKGILLTGVPGTGKSLSAKAIGSHWKLPTVRLDVGKVMTGLVGGSEAKMRDAIAQAEALAPAVLWIDEVEKSLSGTKSSNFSDGGTLARVFGTLLTAMEDGLEGVTIVATANDITMLPPEFIRRFNEVFFVDLPGPEERWEIFTIHLSKKNRNIESFAKDKDKLLASSDGYTGAEIEKAIHEAIATAFCEGFKDVTAEHIISALENTKPISKIMAKKVKALRQAAQKTYRFASSWAEQAASKKSVKTKKGKALDLNKTLDDLPEVSSEKKIKIKAQEDKRDKNFDDLIDLE